jgi:SAM-dependent methyltransferase
MSHVTFGRMPRCPACGRTESRRLFVVHDAAYVACLGCGLARIDPFPSTSDLLANFSSGYFEGADVAGGYDDYAADEPLHRRNARRRLARIARDRHRVANGGTGSLLDIGCAYGYALDEARAQGWSVVGVEPAVAAAQRARTLGMPIFPVTEAALAEQPDGFDVVCMCQVLSHVPDPFSAIASAAKCLKPGGILFIETWRRDALLARLSGRHWHVIAPPTVVWLETSASIRRALGRVGLDIVGWTRGRKTVSLGLVASLLADRPPGPLAAAARRIAHSRWARSSLIYPFADLVWVTARRPGSSAEVRG